MLHLSFDRINESVYAFSAADALASDSEKPLILNPEKRPLLDRLGLDVLSGVILRLMPVITASDHTKEPTPEIISIEANLPPQISPLIFVRELETVLTLGIMSAVWGGTDTPLAAKYRDAFEKHILLLRGIVSSCARPGRIRATA